MTGSAFADWARRRRRLERALTALVSIVLRQPLELGLGEKDQVLLLLTLFVGVITLGTGRTTVLQGTVHLVIFAAFLFFAVVP